MAVTKTFTVTFGANFDEAAWLADVELYGVEEVLVGWLENDAIAEEVTTDE